MTVNHHKDEVEQKVALSLFSRFMRPKAVLDVGCGYGWKRICFPTDTYYIALDCNLSHLRKARVENRVLAEGKALPFRDGSFDLAYTCTVLMLGRNRRVKEIVREMERVSRKHTLYLESRLNLTYGHRHNYKALSSFRLKSQCEFPKTSPLKLWVFEK